ncbi:MAG: nucleoside-diphosphate sugar epimerase [Friedmanniella sp.]|nr:nucleoside-diphosphate sugar epimerase [Friedmanniella sp.]
MSNAASAPTVAVTGVTGYLGSRVARALAEDGVALRLLARSAARAPGLPGSEVAETSYGDDRSVAALAGIDLLFMVSAAESEDRLGEHRRFVDAAAEAGVRHVVYTSFLGAAPDATFTLGRDHWATEEHIRSRGLGFTFLRDSFYLDFLPLLAGADGVIRGPAGEGRMGAVARDDVARSAVAVLRQPAAHLGATYNLTGAESLTLAEAAAITTEVTGRLVTFHHETVPEAYASRASYGAPDWQLDAWVSTYTAIAEGSLDVLTDDVRRLTGSAPLTLRQLLAAATA